MLTRTRADVVRRLLANARFEVLPTARVQEAVATHLAPGSTITVTASPSKGLEATVALTERLAACGYDVVPHLAARMIAGRSELAEIAARLRESGVTTVFVRGVTTPILVGLPGPVDRTKLLSMATKIGVGESTRFLVKHRGVFARIAAPGAYDPLRLLTRAAGVLGDDQMFVTGLHLFTFNQVAETEAWRVAQLARLRGLGRTGADRAASAVPGRLA